MHRVDGCNRRRLLVERWRIGGGSRAEKHGS